MSELNKIQLTAEDKARYREQIKNIDLSLLSKITDAVPAKIKKLLETQSLNEIQVRLLNDTAQLYTILTSTPDLEDDVKRDILFALQYFVEQEDEIPDDIPGIGFLDDYLVVQWVVEEIKEKYSRYFKAWSGFLGAQVLFWKLPLAFRAPPRLSEIGGFSLH